MKILLVGILAVALSACTTTTPKIALPRGTFTDGSGATVDVMPSKQVRLGHLYTTVGGTGTAFYSVDGAKYREICPLDYNRTEIKDAVANTTSGGVVAPSLKRTFKGEGSIGVSVPFISEVGVGTTSSYEARIEYKDVTLTQLADASPAAIEGSLGTKCDELIKGRDVYLVSAVHTASVNYLLKGKVDGRLGAPQGATLKFEVFGNPVTIGTPGSTGIGGSQEFEDEGTYNGLVTAVVLTKIR